MTLLHPTAGEVLDRITILDIKIAAAGQWGNVQHWIQERTDLIVLRDELICSRFEDGEAVQAHMEHSAHMLRGLNERIWKLIDAMHELPLPGKSTDLDKVYRTAEVGKETAMLNDQRMDVIRGVNRLFDQDQPEKIFGGVVQV